MEEFIKKWLYDPTMGKLVTIFIGLVVISALVRILKRLITKYIKDNANKYRVAKSFNALGYFLFILLITIVYSDRLGGFSVALGVAGAGIAFSLQEVIVSFAGWLTILFGGFYKTGDRVQLGGIRGDVMDIGVLRTTIMEIGEWVNGDLYNGRIVLVANSFVFKEPVFNYSRSFPFVWDELVIPIKFGSDYKFAQALFLEILKGHVDKYTNKSKIDWQSMTSRYMIEEARIEPFIHLKFDHNWIELTLRYIVDYKRRRSVKHELSVKILDAIYQNQDKVQVAASTLEITAFPGKVE
jgi:small-conductance mechanosensitive channel